MNGLMKIILILTLNKFFETCNILENKDVRRTMEYLCPGVDICSRNIPDARVNSNVIFNGVKTSCCHGCSCHKSCHLSLNCCFPNGNGNVSNGQISPFDIENLTLNEATFHIKTDIDSKTGNSSSMVKRRRKREAKQSISFSGDDLNTPFVRPSVPANKTRTNTVIDHSIQQQCVYARTGIPDKHWVNHESAYRMVTVPPPNGCTANTACNSLTNHNQPAACDSKAVAPWGDLFPVYSAKHILIYKNALCACCHGVSGFQFWTPLLVCDEIDLKSLRRISFAEHFTFLQQSNTFANHCFVRFYHADQKTMIDNQCFVNSLNQCRLSLASSFLSLPDNVNMSRSEIVMACYNGPYAPVKYFGEVYKNVFCAMCNGAMFIYKQYIGRFQIAYLVNTKTIMMLTPRGLKDEIKPYPTACLKRNTEWIEESCRLIACPSGQGRNEDGVCKGISKGWFRHTYALVKLKYITSNTTILPILNKDEISRNITFDAFKQSKPWSSDWDITELHHTSLNNKDGPLIAVGLITKLSLTKRLITQTEVALRINWNISLDGLNIAFEQSLLEYTLMAIGGGRKVALWTRYVNHKVPHVNVSKHLTTYCESFHLFSVQMQTFFQVTKLLFCEHVSLFEDEYTITPGSAILINKLTNKTMFDREFELVEDGNGNLVPIVCLVDTPLVVRNDKSSSPPLSNYFISLGLIIYVEQLLTSLF